MRCQKCGAYIRDDSVFCNYCGEKVFLRVPKKEDGLKEEAVRPRDEDFDAAPTTPKAEDERKLPQKQRPWVIALIILAGVVFAVLSVLVYQVQKKNQRIIINPQTGPDTAQSSSEESSTAETQAAVIPGGSTAEEIPEETEVPSQSETAAETEADTAETPANTETEPAETDTPGESTDAENPGAETDGGSEPETESETPVPEGVEVEYGGMVYLVTDGKATLKKCYSSDEVVELPDNINGVPLTAIGEAAFANCEHLIAIDVPEGVETFGPYAFTYCRKLRAVVIPASMTTLGDHCFDYVGRMVFVVTEGSVGYQAAVNNELPYVLGDNIQAANEYEW